MKAINFIIFLVLFILISNPAIANAGTALMWMPVLQLFIGNIVIGIIEGSIITIFYKTKLWKSVLVMIGANYVSWILGNLLIVLFQNFIIDAFFKLQFVFELWIISLIILYVLTVLIEWPFIRWTFFKTNRNWKLSFRLSLLINVFTYVAMTLIYLNVSKYNFFTDLKINQSLLADKTNFEITYINDGKIWEKLISREGSEKEVFTLPNEKRNYLLILKVDSVNKKIDLYLSDSSNDSLMVKKAWIDYRERINYPYISKYRHLVYANFRLNHEINWDAFAGGWAIDGLRIKEENKKEVRYAFEVPWMFWSISNVSYVNNSELVCNFHNRIILINKDTREVAFITRGNGYIIHRKQAF